MTNTNVFKKYVICKLSKSASDSFVIVSLIKFFEIRKFENKTIKMIKIALVSSFLLALACSASGDKINCYYCAEGDTKIPGVQSSITKFFQTRASVSGLPTNLCANPIDNSTVVEIDTEKTSCVKIDTEVTQNGNTTKATFRMTIPMYTCPDFDRAFKATVEAAGAEGDVYCYECDEDRCNLASTVQVSFVMLLAPALAYLMRS